MLESESGPEHKMIAIRTSTPVFPIGEMQGSAPGRASPTFFDLLDELACGVYGLEAASDATFCDTIPAVCWAVPGAYASSVDC